MISSQPLSSSAIAALIWELNALDALGPNPLEVADSDASNTPAVAGKRLARALDRLRSRGLPKTLQSLNTSRITVVRRTRTSTADNPLGSTYVVTTEYVYAAVIGASAESLERGFLSIQDYEVIIAAQALTTPLTESDAIRIDGSDYDIIGIRGYPQVPSPVAYRYWLKKAS